MQARLMFLAAVGAATLVAGGGFSSAEAPVAQCMGESVTVGSTAGNDDIDLSSETEPQVVNGLGGDDSIHGGSAADTLCGASGIDEVYGNEGRDKISTGSGRDYGMGDEGADVVKGGPDKDGGEVTWRVGTIDEGKFGAGVDGGDGNDRMKGGDGGDEMRGEEGNDVIRGDGGTDRCNGGPGDDDVDCEEPFIQD